MYFVQFNTPSVVPFLDPKAFEKRVKRWMTVREGENSYFLSRMPEIVSPKADVCCFTVEEDRLILAAGVYYNNILLTTWATHDVCDLIAAHACDHRWKVLNVCAPGHVSYFVAKAYADRTRHIAEVDRGERIYQLTHATYELPKQGHLVAATEQDRPLVCQWVQGFIEEAQFEAGGHSAADLTATLIGQRMLYLWKSPQPVSMAAWVSPTPNGASLNFVYTPPEFRGQGYGKAVCAGLAAQMLASGLKYCFILTDIHDDRTNGLYQAIGARTLCEFLRCNVRPQVAAAKTPQRQQECGVQG
jgi:ribosomal protein S18 acetylase RimI-like enzyme